MKLPDSHCKQPTLLKNWVSEWPAIKRWEPDYLVDLAGNMEVEVVVGEREAALASYKKVKLAEVFLTAENQTVPYYLKEYDLLKTIPELKEDLYLKKVQRKGCVSHHLVWASHRGARTGNHYDLIDNVLTQLVGIKRVTCISPAFHSEMYVSPKHDVFARVSRVNGFSPDLKIFPLFSEARKAEMVFDLHPGDSLYIPRGWWHRVESLSQSISLSGFMLGPLDCVRLVPEFIRHGLHRCGLYKKGNCACH